MERLGKNMGIAKIDKAEWGRYMKHVILEDVGVAGQVKLKQAKILVIGAGGLGTPILQYLNAVGIGTLGMADFDVIEISNLHRQVLYNHEDLGKKKVDVAFQRLGASNPYTHLAKHDVLLHEENAAAIIGDYDLVIDGCDNFMTRYVVNDTCLRMGKPLVYGSILGYQGQLAVFNHAGSKNLRQLFPEPPAAEDVPSCSENGVLGTVPGIVGTMMAQLAVQAILGNNPLENKFLLVDLIGWQITTLDY